MASNPATGGVVVDADRLLDAHPDHPNVYDREQCPECGDTEPVVDALRDVDGVRRAGFITRGDTPTDTLAVEVNRGAGQDAVETAAEYGWTEWEIRWTPHHLRFTHPDTDPRGDSDE